VERTATVEDAIMQTVFAYRAAAPDGRLHAGALDAESAEQARDTLRARGLLILNLESRGARVAQRDAIAIGDLALGLRILADLLDAGLSVSRALGAFEELASRGWRPALPHIRQSVREGHGLAASLASAPIAVPGLVIGIVQAGEAGTGIGQAMRRAAELTESSAETRSQIRAALAYPLLVAAAGAVATTVLLTVVLPRFARILGDLGQKLPATTRLVIAGADLAHAALIPVLVAMGIGVGVWRAWTGTASGRRSCHRLLLGVPFLGSIRRGAAASRMATSLSALLDSGVSMAAALSLAAHAAGDAELEARVSAARGAVSAGESLSRAIEIHDAATPTVVRLARAGEETGRLSAMLGHGARIEQQRVDRVVRTAVRMLEPMLLLAFASIVALIAAALLQAIYSVRPAA
jgi:type II secretory pathway component PulF